MVLLPMIEKFTFLKKKLKFLEIGLGCNMEYGPGASVKVWKKLFENRNADIWEAERDGPCVAKHKKEGNLDGINLLIGDQSKEADLNRWVQESGGKFDVIIDDGGHRCDMIMKTYEVLWPEINPDGFYFIEDLEISFSGPFSAPGCTPVTVVMQAWIEMLHVGAEAVSHHHQHVIQKYPLPKGLDYMLCQKSSCVLHKQALLAPELLK